MKKIWSRFKLWVKQTWKDPQKAIADAKAIVRALRLLRSAVNSPQAEILIQTIPGQVDDIVLQAIKYALDKLLQIPDAWDKLPELAGKEVPESVNSLIHKTGSVALTKLNPQIDEIKADHMIQLEYMHQKLEKM